MRREGRRVLYHPKKKKSFLEPRCHDPCSRHSFWTFLWLLRRIVAFFTARSRRCPWSALEWKFSWRGVCSSIVVVILCCGHQSPYFHHFFLTSIRCESMLVVPFSSLGYCLHLMYWGLPPPTPLLTKAKIAERSPLNCVFQFALCLFGAFFLLLPNAHLPNRSCSSYCPDCCFFIHFQGRSQRYDLSLYAH